MTIEENTFSENKLKPNNNNTLKNIVNFYSEEVFFTLLELKDLKWFNEALFVNNKENILSNPHWIKMWYFIESLKNYNVDDWFYINKKNFIEYMNNTDPLFILDESLEWLTQDAKKIFTKEWFLWDLVREKIIDNEIFSFSNLEERWLLIFLWENWIDFTEYIENSDIVNLNDEFNYLREKFGFNIMELAWKDKNWDFVFKYDVFTFYNNLIDLISYKNIWNSNLIWENKCEFLLIIQNTLFKKYKISLLDKNTFITKISDFSYDKDIEKNDKINYSDSILEITTLLDKKETKYFLEEFLDFFHMYFSIVLKEWCWKINDFEQILLKIYNEIDPSKNNWIEIFKKYKDLFLDNLISYVKENFFIKSFPDELDENQIKTVINHLIYCANINWNNPLNKNLILFILILKLNNKLNYFLKWDWDLDDYIDYLNYDDIKFYIYLKNIFDKIKSSTIKNDLNEKDYEIIKIEEKFVNISNNFNDEYLFDLQMYSWNLLIEELYNENWLKMIQLIYLYPKKIWKILTNKFNELEKNKKLSDEDIKILEKIKVSFNIKDFNIKEVKKLQDIFKNISSIIEFIDFVWNINNIKKWQRKEYIEEIKRRFKSLYIKLYWKQKKIDCIDDNKLKIKMNFLYDFLFKNVEKREIESLFTSDFDKIIPNIRWCLSCIRKVIFNDTNLSFLDDDRFLIISSVKWEEKSISDQAVFLYKKWEKYIFVLDKIYWDKSEDIFINHILLLVNKMKKIDKNIEIFLPSSSYLGDIDYKNLKTKLLEKDKSLFIWKSSYESVIINKSEVSNIYLDFWDVSTQTWLINSHWIVIKLIKRNL